MVDTGYNHGEERGSVMIDKPNNQRSCQKADQPNKPPNQQAHFENGKIKVYPVLVQDRSHTAQTHLSHAHHGDFLAAMVANWSLRGGLLRERGIIGDHIHLGCFNNRYPGDSSLAVEKTTAANGPAP